MQPESEVSFSCKEFTRRELTQMMAGRILRLFQELYLKKDSLALQVLSLIFPFVQRDGRFRKYDRDDPQEVECYRNQRTRDALNGGVTQM